MLETIQTYGRELLAASGEQDRLRRAHRDYCEWLTVETGRAWFTPEELVWTRRMLADIDNLRTAITYCLTEPGQARHVSRITGCGYEYVWLTSSGLGDEFHRYLDRALRQDPEPTRDRAAAVLGAASLATYTGNLTRALPLLREGRALAERLGATQMMDFAASCSGAAASLQADYPRAIALLEEALDLHQQAHSPPGYSWMTRMHLVAALASNGQTDRAKPLAEQLLAEVQHLDLYRAYALWALGTAQIFNGEVPQAITTFQDSLRATTSHPDLMVNVLATHGLACATALTPEQERAAQLFGICRMLWRLQGDIPMQMAPSFTTHRDSFEATLRDKLGDQTFTAAYQRGAALSHKDALAYAIGDTPTAPSPATPETTAAYPLTRREHQVAELVAKGMTNQDIAHTLVISARTAEAHVQHILVKLGFTARSQIAAWIAGNPADPPPADR